MMLLVAIVVLSISFVLARPEYPEARTIGNNVESFDELSGRFAALAEEKGAEYAFDVLRIAQLPPQTDMHLLGHVVGDMLYEQQGVGGIAVCTQDFRNACSHAMVIGALTEYGGESALSLIRDACTRAPGGTGAYTMCYHGLGHGVFAYYGYSLPETIAFCKQTGTETYHHQEYVECVGGAIMELTGGGGHDTEAWEEARRRYLTHPLSPCMDPIMPDEVKSMCLTYLTPEIWASVGISLGQPQPALFEKAFEHCDAIPHTQQQLRDACYGGFGKEFVPIAGERDVRHIDQLTDEQYEKAASWCRMARETDGQQACLGQAVASIFWGGENDPGGALRFCALSGGEELQRACFESLAIEIQRYVIPEKQKELCGRFPQSMQSVCYEAL